MSGSGPKATTAVGVEPRLSVAMPAFNEEATVLAVAKRVLDSPHTQELIIVDDGSTDDTLDRIRQLDNLRAQVVEQWVDQRKGAALRRGFVEAQAPFVVVQDSDLEYDPRDFERLLDPLLSGQADAVCGSRFHTGSARRVLYFWHTVGDMVLTTASNALTDLNLVGYGDLRQGLPP